MYFSVKSNANTTQVIQFIMYSGCSHSWGKENRDDSKQNSSVDSSKKLGNKWYSFKQNRLVSKAMKPITNNAIHATVAVSTKSLQCLEEGESFKY